MSWLQNDLSQTLQRTPQRLDQLSSLIDPQWITQVLSATGKASIRRRKLPAEHVIWLVIGLALFRNQPIWDVARQLQLTLHNQPLSVPSAAVAGRQRLGEEPLAHLFRLLCQGWTACECVCQRVLGLRLLAVDGVVWATPDTPDNRLALGSSSNQHGSGGWPQIRAVCLMDTYSHEAPVHHIADGCESLSGQRTGQAVHAALGD
ncbi:transposase domain-containing protein [Limnohabitans sp.]|uniref:transposase domain-containing protein n=1 Tax=Limnohabitans sp. TaxID=1907725 RepID=UPI0025BE0186|nr:transposase domain-containing protein [Limnohabitans sp.]